MNEEQLIEFVNWLPSAVPEFKNATPDQIVQALNQMSESDEGQQMLSQLINTFQQAKQSANSQMFKKGGKLAAFVSKYGRGGEMCCKKKAILQGGMANKVAEKMQDGGETPSLTRREAREQAAANRGFSRGQFQIAMANAKNALRGAGLRGRDLRQQARQMVAGQPEVIEESRPVFQGIERVNNGLDSILPGRASTLSSTGIITRESEQPSFEDIFARARSAGAKEFLYNGKKYNTLYKEELPYLGVDPKYNFRTPYSAGWTDPDLARQGTGYYVTAPEYQKEGGELATNTSANTLSNFGLLPKAQEGKKIDFFSDLSGLNDMKFVQRSNNGKLVEMAPTREELPGNKGIQSMGFSRMITGPEGQMDTLYFRTYPNAAPVELFLDNAKKKKFNSVVDSLLTRAKLPTKITK